MSTVQNTTHNTQHTTHNTQHTQHTPLHDFEVVKSKLLEEMNELSARQATRITRSVGRDEFEKVGINLVHIAQ